MDKGFLKEKLKLQRKKKAKGDLILKIAVITIFSGYLIFFLSGYLFPSPKKDIISFKVGDSLNLDNYVLTLNSWDYAEDDKTFEIMFSVDDLTFDKKIDIDFSFREKSSIYDAKIYKKVGDDIIVVRAKDIPKDFSVIYLTAEAKGKSGYLQIDKDNIHVVEKLEKRTDKEYIKYGIESKINALKEIKSKAKRELKKMQERTLTAYDKLDKLHRKKENQTEAEQKITDDNISKVALEMGNLKGEMDMKFMEIDEIEKKIEAQRKLLESMK